MIRLNRIWINLKKMFLKTLTITLKRLDRGNR